MRPRTWTREETLAAFNLYCRTPFGRLHAHNPEIVELAAKLGRTVNSVAMKCCNLASLDPALQQRGIRGLQSASQLDRQIWTEFDIDPETVGYESAQAFAGLTQQPLDVESEETWQPITGLERSAVTQIRVNQRLFRVMVIVGYGTRCAVCQLPISALLVASHIVPWSVDPAHRMNPHNGICLCSLHDKAFDTGYMVIDDDLRIRFTEKLTRYYENEAVKSNLTFYEGNSILLPERWHPSRELLARHGSYTVEFLKKYCVDEDLSEITYTFDEYKRHWDGLHKAEAISESNLLNGIGYTQEETQVLLEETAAYVTEQKALGCP